MNIEQFVEELDDELRAELKQALAVRENVELEKDIQALLTLLTNERAKREDLARKLTETISELYTTKQRLAEALGFLQHRGGPLCMTRYYSECECTCGVGPFLAKQETKQ